MNSYYTFPVGIPSVWAEPAQFRVPNPHLKSWLLDVNSLTERLQSQCQTFHLTLLGQRQVEVSLEEFQQVRGPKQQLEVGDWQVREVLLWGDGKPWVFARSIIPQKLCENDFVNLNDKPLGQLIFNDRRFKRLPFQLTNIRDKSQFYEALNIDSERDIWGRRSTFCFENLKMMVSEIFLPESPAYQNMV